MILTIPARELHTALTGLAKVTPRKASLPILQGVLIEAAGNTVRLTSTDLDSTVNYTVVNADDRSHGFDSRLVWSWRNSLDLTIGVQRFAGSAGSEYARMSNGAFAQLQWFY